MSSESTRPRVLAFDGKGLKGTFIAAILAEGEGSTGRSIAGHFELIAGPFIAEPLGELGIGQSTTRLALLVHESLSHRITVKAF